MIMRIGIILTLAFTLASCGVARNVGNTVGLGKGATNRTQVEANGVRYKARTASDRADRRAFTATASPVAPDVQSAVDAAVYQATRYCILEFGGSDTDWEVGPDTPLDAVPIQDGSVVLKGRCTQR
ncbi:MAG: hypothetical protein AAGP08_11965 [Pseudomonadota bacterium]